MLTDLGDAGIHVRLPDNQFLAIGTGEQQRPIGPRIEGKATTDIVETGSNNAAEQRPAAV